MTPCMFNFPLGTSSISSLAHQLSWDGLTFCQGAWRSPACPGARRGYHTRCDARTADARKIAAWITAPNSYAPYIVHHPAIYTVPQAAVPCILHQHGGQRHLDSSS